MQNELDREIAALEAALAYGREHPYSGVCGEDDAAADRLEDLKNERKWNGIRAWLRTSDSDWFHDEAVMGSLPQSEADELLEDFGLKLTPANLKQLSREIDASLKEGR